MRILQSLSAWLRPKDDRENIIPDSIAHPVTKLPQVAWPNICIGRATNVGQVRTRNEDSFYVFNSLVFNEDNYQPFALLIVADGMGGHKRGDLASSVAVHQAAKHILERAYLPFLSVNGSVAEQTPVNDVLREAVEEAHEAVHQLAPGGGTTLTIAAIINDVAYIAHVGDSRIYFHQHNSLKAITKDHSLVARLVEIGQTTAEDAINHPHRNVLYRAIGQSGPVEVDVLRQALPPASQLLICSDGLWGLVNDDNIAKILEKETNPQRACEHLIQLACEKGGNDNITVLIAANKCI
jgi:PPM family protein phosphatase